MIDSKGNRLLELSVSMNVARQQAAIETHSVGARAALGGRGE